MGEERVTPPVPVPRGLRVASFLLSVLLLLLFVWLLGFVLGDIGGIDGPLYPDVVAELVDARLLERADELRREVASLEQSVTRQQELQEDLRRSMDVARQTMQQMMDLQRLALEQQAPPTESEREALGQAQQRFLAAQERFEAANAEIVQANEGKHTLRLELQALERELAEQEQPARAEHQRRWRAHEFRLAAYKLAVIVPLFLAAAWAFARWRRGAYRSILLAALAATFWMLGRVMFEHFPREFFKYIAIAAAIAIVLAFLVWLLRKASRPGRDLLLSRYREAYRAHACPVCAHPIARGPLRFATWTRKGPRAPAAADGQDGAEPESPYTCPACGTALFAACASCGRQRHALLPYCEHCGAERREALAAGTARP